MSEQLPPAGWYPDPQDETRVRYWDGARWTEHVAAPDSLNKVTSEPQHHVWSEGLSDKGVEKVERSQRDKIAAVGFLLCFSVIALFAVIALLSAN